MAGLFNFLSLITTKIYPIFASTQAYLEYEKANSLYNSGTFTIGGINVPINTILKKASGDSQPVPDEAVLLVYHSNKVHKWLIFWIVSCTYELAGTVLLLKYIIPFYSLFRFGVSLWLLFPFLRPSQTQEYNSQQDMSGFFNSGCGFCFKQAANYFTSSDSYKLQDIGAGVVDVKQLQDMVQRFIDFIVKNTPIPLGLVLKLVSGSSKTGAADDNAKGPEDTNSKAFSSSFQGGAGAEYVESLRSFGASKLQDFFAGQRKNDVVEEEYDVVENPVSESSSNETSNQTPQKRGWIW